jgi:DNA replication and repair protein RecF
MIFFDKLDESGFKIIEMVNSDTFGQLFISDTHPERGDCKVNAPIVPNI